MEKIRTLKEPDKNLRLKRYDAWKRRNETYISVKGEMDISEAMKM